MTKDQKLLQNAFNLHRQGRLVEAGNIYELLIKRNTNNYDALHFLGTIKASFGNFTEARKLIERSLAAKHINIPYVENYATILFQNGAYERAVKICSKIIKENRSTEHLQYILAVSLYKLDCIKEAISEFDRLLLAHPNHLAGNNEKAAALAKLEMYDEALLYVDKALKINPRYAEGFLHKGNILLKLKKYDESLLAYRQALSINQNLPDVYLGYGNVLRELRHHDEAFAAYDKALALKPDFADAWLGRGNVFTDLNRYGEAFAAYDKALALRPDLAEAWLGRGNVFNDLRRYDEAFAAYDKALALKPDLTNAEGARLHSKMHLCDWSNFDAETAHLISAIRSGTPTIPFSLLAISPSLRDQLQDATLWTANECPLFEKLIWQGERYDHDKIRVAYLSADFREHPMSFLMAGIFEHHDKSRFNVAGISLGPDDNSEIRQRLKATFERFIDAKTFSDEQIANLVRSSEVDILVDLMGFTAGARTGVFARRPAPVQVNYLGYPATMGAEYIDYIIGDRIVIPDDCRKFYSEKIAILPNTYQANDRKRIIADKAFTRSDVGLPPKGFVFCCFNNNYKITPRVFDSWMRILKQIEGSVIWLLELNASAAGNLKKEAVARGVSAERLVFAKRMPLPEHLARHNLADLFLDTLPYNAHTTASDALWAGLPVLTCLGETFAGRVAASLLNAIRLPELITTTLDAYEEMAIDLATHPEKLAAIKRKLAENCLTTPLFDIKLFTKHIEAAYSIMWERYQRGEPPESFSVDPLEQQLKYQ